MHAFGKRTFAALSAISLLLVLPARGTQAAPLQWTGTIKEVLHSVYMQSGSANTIQEHTDCQTTISFGADGTAASTSTYSYSRVVDDKPSANYESKTTTTQTGGGSASYAGYLSVSISSNGAYTISYQPEPPFTVQQTVTIETTGQQTTTYTVSTQARCDLALGLSGTLKSQTMVDGTATENDPLGKPGTYTVTWQLSTGGNGGSPGSGGNGAGSGGGNGKAADKPKITIKASNKGIEAGLEYKGFDISYSQDWTPEQKKGGAPPTLSSPGNNVKLTIDETPATTSPAAAAQGMARSQPTGAPPASGTPATRISRMVAKPFSVGQLAGTMVTYTVAGSPDTWVVVVVGNGQHQVVVQIDIKPNTPPEQLLEAGATLGSIVLTS